MTNDNPHAPSGANSKLKAFFHKESTGGVLLLAATICALLWANSPWQAAYEAFWHGPAIHFAVNDGLMAVFFLAVGLEIRREIHGGTLSNPQAAALPVVAALGGIVAPALIYLAWSSDHAALRAGWAIPTATDIAFAVGGLALLGKRAAPSLRILLLALAIADDVVAVLIIAFFYSGGIAWQGLAIAVGGTAFALALRYRGVQNGFAYVLMGVVIWIGFWRAGVHPVLAGVVLGLLTPEALANKMEAALHSWVALGIMPLFALANAGIHLAGLGAGAESLPLITSIVLALVVGKPAGIVAATALAVRLRLCQLPAGMNWRGVLVVGCLGGIGFTMSIFIATLAFSDAALLAAAKLGVLVASIAAAVAALVIARVVRLRAPA